MFANSENLWGIILSVGEGTRLQQLVKEIYGRVRPKQYCSIVGTRSMLRHTFDRMKSLIPPEKILTVVNPTHLKYVEAQLPDQPPILVQPCGRETASGILLPLLQIYYQDPRALVGIFPSDHFVLEEERFMRYVELAFRYVGNHTNSIVLLGCSASQVEPGYGWIEKGGAIDNPWHLKMHRISRFWEKPGRFTAEALFARGCLWNTLIMIGTVGAYLSEFRRIVPKTFAQLDHVMRLPHSGERETLLNRIFPTLPSVNFSAAILERCTDRLSVLEVSDIYWSDWGEENRVLRDVERLNLKLHNPGVLAPL